MIRGDKRHGRIMGAGTNLCDYAYQLNGRVVLGLKDEVFAKPELARLASYSSLPRHYERAHEPIRRLLRTIRQNGIADSGKLPLEVRSCRWLPNHFDRQRRQKSLSSCYPLCPFAENLHTSDKSFRIPSRTSFWLDLDRRSDFAQWFRTRHGFVNGPEESRPVQR